MSAPTHVGPPSTRPRPRPPARLPGLSVVLPCFDEEENVARAVEEAIAAATRHADEVEVVVVDDGSRDATGAIAGAIAETDPRVRVVRHPVNRGYGAAVRSGFEATTMPWVLLTDGDCQFDLTELAGVIPLTAGCDLVAGYRIGRADPIGRRIAAHAWNLLVRRSFGIGVRDVDCAFKLLRGDAVRALELRSEGAMISTELLTRAQLAGWRVSEAGVHHRPRVAGRPSGGDPRVVLRAFRERRALTRALRAEAAAGEGPRPAAVPSRAAA